MAADSKCCVHIMNKEVGNENWYKTDEGNDFWDQFSASEQESDDDDDTINGELGFTYTKGFPTSLNLLTDPNIWICETRASAHASGHNCGMIKSGR
eukprot:3302935-Ditylum_brightwellii.AAC.1